MSAPHTSLKSTDQYYDLSSYANADAYSISHIDLDLSVDFNRKTITGQAKLTVVKNAGGDKLVLDTNKLTISKIVGAFSGGQHVDLKYSLGPCHPTFGTPVTIEIPAQLSSDNQFVLSVDYQTSPEASALQWLKASQTHGKKHPYVFSQCQAIHCRSLIPCQDTPAVKQTYLARLKVPDGLCALMSANAREVKDGSFIFRQTIPISSYLIALAVGNLKHKVLSTRSSVWCEPEGLDEAAEELADVEQLLLAAESIMGPYIWGPYDVLVLPPSFPYGGMENPCITFATPTIVAGDKSSINVIAHEISHSWSGNLFTNKNWGHFWLNEGHTRFIEAKILARLYGEEFGNYFNSNGYKALVDVVETFGPDSPYTQLVIDMNGVDPDECYSIVPYEKGAAFLQYLEQEHLGEKLMVEFLRALVEKYKFKSLDSDEYVRFLTEFCAARDPAVASSLKQVDWENWLHGKGLPRQFVPAPPTELDRLVQKAFAQWTNESPPADPVEIKLMFPLQIQDFLDRLIRKAPLSKSTLQGLEKTYNFGGYKNYEIKYRWLLLTAKSHYQPSLNDCLEFVKVVGRLKYVKPMYTALAAWPQARVKALKTFEDSKDSMHSVTVAAVSRIFA